MGQFSSSYKTPDPATGLSRQDIALIKKSWNKVTEPAKLKENAVELFIQLFSKYPSMKNYFDNFKNLTESQMRENPQLRAHALGVCYMISAYAQNADDPETLVALVEKINVSHAARGISVESFENLGAMFVPFLKTLLGKKVNANTETAWSKLLGAQVALYKAHLQSA